MPKLRQPMPPPNPSKGLHAIGWRLFAAVAGFFISKSLPPVAQIEAQPQAATISAPAPSAQPTLAPVLKTFSSAEFDSIVAGKNRQMKHAKLRARWRQIPLDQLAPELEKVAAADMDLLSTGLKIWASRDSKTSREWMLAKFPGTPAALIAWIEGFAIISPTLAMQWYDAQGAADVAAMNLEKAVALAALAGSAAESNPEAAWAFLKDRLLNAQTARQALQLWVSKDPASAIAAWKSMRESEMAAINLKQKPTDPPATTCEADGLLPEIHAGLKKLPKESALALLTDHGSLMNEAGMKDLISADPGWWLNKAMSSEAPSAMKSAAASWAKGSPRWTLGHLDHFDPETQQQLIASSLESSSEFKGGPSATLAGRKLTAWFDQLQPELQGKVASHVAAGMIVDDATAALKLTTLSTDPNPHEQLFNTTAFLTAVEPRMLEQKILGARGTEEQIANLRIAASLGTGGWLSSPHDSICRAASFTDPALRHQSIVMTLANTQDPDVRRMTTDWLSAMPPGTVDKAQLGEALQRMKLHVPQFQQAIKETSQAKDAPNFDAVNEIIQHLP